MKPKIHTLDLIDSRLKKLDRPYAKTIERIEGLRPLARRYIFDSEASAYIGRFIRDCGDLIIANRQFALAPYPMTYLEFDIATMIDTLGRSDAAKTLYGDYSKSDRYVGYLLHNDTIYSVCADENKRAGVSLFKYTTNVPTGPGAIFKGYPIRAKDPNDEWARAALLLGTTMSDIPDEATRLDIIRGTNIQLVTEVNPEAIHTVLHGAMGDLRNVWAMLLLINQKRNVSFNNIPHSVGILRGKRHVYAAYSLIKIHLGPTETVRKIFSSGLPHLPRRRHDVAGHFAHYHLRDGCIHSWPFLPEIDEDETPRWTCASCDGLRVWKKNFVRGSGGVGVVVKDYEVTE